MKRIRLAIYLLLFAVLVGANNCGGGGGGAGTSVLGGGGNTVVNSGNSLLDLLSSNQLKVTSLETRKNTILGNVALILSVEGNELDRVVAQTNESGTYTFEGVKIGVYNLRGVKPGYRDTNVRVTVTDGPVAVRILLEPADPPTSISGTIKDISTDKMISDVYVEILDLPQVISSRSNADGKYVLNDVSPGTYTIKASKSGYASQERANIIKNPNIPTQDVNFELSPSATSEIKLPGKIRGIVKDAVDFQPLTGVTVQLKGASLGTNTTDGQGYFNFDNVDADIQYILTAYTLSPARKGTGDRIVTGYYQIFTQTNVSIGSGQIQIFDILMSPNPVDPAIVYAEFAGSVLDAVSSAPLEAAKIDIVGTAFSGQTNASGAFHMTGISAGIEYIFLFSKAGYYTKSHTQALSPGYNTLALDNKTIRLEPVSSTRNKATLVGTVRDDYSGNLLPGVKVEVLGTTVSATTNDSGTYLINDIPVPSDPGVEQPTAQITLIFTKDGYRPLTLPVLAEGGRTKQVDAQQLPRMKGTIVVTVYDSKTQNRIDGALVTFQGFTPKSGTNFAATSGGRVTFADIPLGTYNFTISQDQYATTTLTGVVLSQDLQTVNAAAYLNRDIINVEGYVYNETNNIDGFQSGPGGDAALAGITVTVVSEGGSGSTTGTATSLTNGYYRISNLPVGVRYLVRTSGTGAAGINFRHEQREVTLQVGNNRVDHGLYKIYGSISGFVFQDENGDGVFSNEPRVGGAVLTVTNLTEAQTDIVTTGTTDSAGGFLIQNVKAGNIKIQVNKDDANYQSTFKIVPMTDGASIADVAIPMVLQNTSISGQVLDGANNRPVAGVAVSIVGHAGITATTDALGAYRLDSVPLTPPTKVLLFDATTRGYGIATATATVDSGAPTIIQQPTLLYRATRLVYGSVLDARTGIGVAGIQVTLTYSEGSSEIATTLTTVSGGFTFPNVLTSDSALVTLEFRDPSNQINGRPRYSPATRQITVTAGESPLRVSPDVLLTPNFTNIRGYVLESSTNQPLNTSVFKESGTLIRAQVAGTNLSAEVSLASGEYLIRNVPVGENYTIAVSHVTTGDAHFRPEVKGITTGSGVETYAGIIYVTLLPAKLYGSVFDAKAHFPTATPANIAPVRGATVRATIASLPAFSATATTDTNGAYVMNVPPYDNYTITVTASGFETAARITDEIALAGERADFSLVPITGTVAGSIYLDENGNGLLDGGDRRIDQTPDRAVVFTVFYTYKGLTFRSDSLTDGTYRLEEVPIGSRYLEIAPKTGVTTDLGSAVWVDPNDPNNYLVRIAASGTTPGSVDFLVQRQGVGGGRIYGYAYDRLTGASVGGVECRLYRTTDFGLVATTTADPEGFFTFNNVPYYSSPDDPDEIFVFEMKKAGYVTISSDKHTDPTSGQIDDIRLGPDRTVRRIDAFMTPNQGNILGRIFDGASGAPVSGASVRLVGVPGYTFQTDALGEFDMQSGGAGIRAGVYSVNIAAQNYATRTINGVTIVDNSDEVRLDVALNRQFGNIKGYLYEERNGIPGYQAGGDKPLGQKVIQYIPLADATALPANASTNANGYYEISNLVPGVYQFTFGFVDTTADDDAEHTPVVRSLTIADGITLNENVELTSLNGAIEGYVYADENGNGTKDANEPYLTGVNVGDLAVIIEASSSGVTPTEGVSQTDGGGYYYLPLATGLYAIKVTSQSLTDQNAVPIYQDRTVMIDFTPGAAVRYDFGLVPITGKIMGTVLDSTNRRPLQGVKVFLLGTPYAAITNASGEYTISNVPILPSTTDTYTQVFDFVSGGYAMLETAIDKPSATTKEFRAGTTLLTPKTRVVSGRVINGQTLDGIAGASAEVALADGLKLGALTDTQGYFAIREVPVKTWEDYDLTVFQAEYETKIVSFYLAPSDATYKITPDIAMTSNRGTIRGRVLDRTTNWPVQSSTIVLQARVTGFARANEDISIVDTATVDNDGYFTLKGIPRGGPYTLTISTNQGANSFFMRDVVRSVSVTGGGTTNLGIIYCYLEEFMVSGSVFDRGAEFAPGEYLGADNATITFTHAASGYAVTTTTNFKGSFEVTIPSLAFTIGATAANFNPASMQRDFAVDSTPVSLLLNPISNPQVRGRVYFDEPRDLNSDGDTLDAGEEPNGYVDPGEKLVYDYAGGLLQGHKLNVFFLYRGVTKSVELLANSSFTFADVPVGSRTFFVEGDDFKAHFWMNSSGLSQVTITQASQSPASIDIAVRTQDSASGNLNGVVRDWKIWEESIVFNGVNADSPYPYYSDVLRRQRANWQVAGIVVRARSGSYIQQTTTDVDGLFHLFLPTGPSGREYQIDVMDPSGMYVSQTTGPVLIAKAQSSQVGVVPQILTENGWVNINALEVIMKPKMGVVSGTIYYDNNLDGLFNAGADYDLIPDPNNEFPVNAVVGHPQRNNNWTETSFLVTYNYRGMTFGSTYYDRSNSVYRIPNVPIGTYGLDGTTQPVTVPVGEAAYALAPGERFDHPTVLRCRDYSRSAGGFDTIESINYFKPVVYATNAQLLGGAYYQLATPFKVSEGKTTLCNFATYVEGGHLLLFPSQSYTILDDQDQEQPRQASAQGATTMRIIEFGENWNVGNLLPGQPILLSSYPIGTVGDWTGAPLSLGEPQVIPPGTYTILITSSAEFESSWDDTLNGGAGGYPPATLQSPYLFFFQNVQVLPRKTTVVRGE